jgi:hypothetical protein
MKVLQQKSKLLREVNPLTAMVDMTIHNFYSAGQYFLRLEAANVPDTPPSIDTMNDKKVKTGNSVSHPVVKNKV